MFSLVYFSAVTLTLISLLFFVLYKYLSRNYDYWQKRKVFFFDPKPFVGNFLEVSLFRTTIGEYLASLYNRTSEPFFGIYVFDKPHLILRSPEIIKDILVKDFSHFEDRNINHQHDPVLESMLFINKNPEWKGIRSKMSPVFTTGKLKAMVPLINAIGEEMVTFIDGKIPNLSLEAKEISTQFSTDVIARCAFAINAHSFDRVNAEFRKAGKMMFDFSWKNAIQQTSHFFLPGLAAFFRMSVLDRDAVTFLCKTFVATVNNRANQGDQKGNDVIDAIIGMQKNPNIVTEGDLAVAQAVQFFAAGFETTSSTIAYTLYEMCIHPQIQAKLRGEILEGIKAHGGITYEAVQGMKYLTMCINESLRKYPVLPFLDRKCKQDYKIPGSNLIVEKGTPVFIPLFGLHYDPAFFPNPERYNPDRFSEANIQKIIPYTFIPFGEGPRVCIGERFGLLGTKLGIVHVLANFVVEKADNTPVPLVFEPKSFVLASKVGLPMKFRRAI